MFAIALTDSVHNLVMENVPSRVAGYLQKVSDFCVLSDFLQSSHGKLQFFNCDLKAGIFILVCKAGKNTEYSFVKHHFVCQNCNSYSTCFTGRCFFLCSSPLNFEYRCILYNFIFISVPGRGERGVDFAVDSVMCDKLEI